jgi:hypothetical protein
MAVLPSLKVIVPVAEAGATFAVSVMGCPETAVAAEAASVTEVACGGPGEAVIVTVTTLEVEDESAASPL